MEFDRYLNNYGPYEFQPFSDREHLRAGEEKRTMRVAAIELALQ